MSGAVHQFIAILTILEVLWTADLCFLPPCRGHKDSSNTYQGLRKHTVVGEDGEGKYSTYKLLLHGCQLKLGKPALVLYHRIKL